MKARSFSSDYKQEHTGLWEAWIEFDPVCEHSFGTFYLFGEAMVASGGRQPLFIKQKDSSMPGRLNLFLQGKKSERLTEVVYCEPVTSLYQYRSVAVYHDGELICELQDIEIMV